MKADFNEMVEYWKCQRILSSSRHLCPSYDSCFNLDGACYNSEVILQICRKPELRKAIAKMEKMTKNKPLGYFAIEKDWWTNKDFWRAIARARIGDEVK